MIRWDAAGVRRRVHDARGGVSAAPYDVAQPRPSDTDDEPERVAENRRLACARGRPDRRRLALQPAGALADRHRRASRARGEPGDGLWTDEPGAASRDVGGLPADRRCAARRPAAALARRSMPAGVASPTGIVEAGVAALGAGRKLAAVIGPAIGPCCYEVGRRSSAPLRRRPDARGPSRSLDGGRTGAAKGGRRRRRPGRPLHALHPGALLLAPARRPGARGARG